MAGETGDVLFGRSAFGGFNRKDVMDYIDKLQRSAAEKHGDPEALLEALAKAERERDELARENARLLEQLAQMKAQPAADVSLDAQSVAESDEAFSATAETVTDGDAKGLSMRDVDEMVQKYFG